MNLVVLKGRTTANVELKTTSSGIKVAPFTLAVDRNYTPKGQEKQTDFINCVAWRNTAEFISKWFNKGAAMLVKGELQARNYTDSNGNKRTAYEVIVESAEFCESKRDNSPAPALGEESTAGTFEEENIASEDFGDDLPF